MVYCDDITRIMLLRIFTNVIVNHFVRGYNIGVRLIEDFLARSNVERCNNLRDVADAISKAAFKMYLGVTPIVSNWSVAGDEFSLMMESNPLIDFVELPPGHESLNFSNILCGVLRGALEMVSDFTSPNSRLGILYTSLNVMFTTKVLTPFFNQCL